MAEVRQRLIGIERPGDSVDEVPFAAMGIASRGAKVRELPSERDIVEPASDPIAIDADMQQSGGRIEFLFVEAAGACAQILKVGGDAGGELFFQFQQTLGFAMA
jgi:hypothetical protein